VRTISPNHTQGKKKRKGEWGECTKYNVYVRTRSPNHTLDTGQEEERDSRECVIGTTHA